MNGKTLLFRTGLLVGLGLALSGIFAGSAPAQTGWNQGEQLLVYRNGNVLKGQVSREIGRFAVQTGSGSRIVVPAEQVDFVCSSLQEAYQFKRERLPAIAADSGARPTARLEFFQWCLKQGLFAEAEAELSQLQRSRLSAGELYGFLRQLRSAMDRAESAARATSGIPPEATEGSTSGRVALTGPPPAAAVAISDLPPLPTQLPSLLDHPLAQSSSGFGGIAPNSGWVRPVAHEQPDADASPLTALPVPELERLLKQLPVEGVSLFKRRVEPLLFRNCSNAGCHDPERTRLPLQRLARGEGIPKRMSQQNLIQVLRFVGSGVEGDSPLLAAATTAHGGAIKPPLKLDSDQYRLLAAWVERLALPSAAAGIRGLHSPLFSGTASPAKDRPPADARPLPTPPKAAEARPAPASISTANTIPEIPPLELKPEPPAVIDPFDPQIFNRKRTVQPVDQAARDGRDG